MEKTEIYAAHGYRVLGLLIREQRKRKRVNGRARGFYEGKYVYVRVRLPDGKKRDFYLGTESAPARRRGKSRVEKGAGELAATARWSGGGERGGEKAALPPDIDMRMARRRREVAHARENGWPHDAVPFRGRRR